MTDNCAKHAAELYDAIRMLKKNRKTEYLRDY